MYNVPTYTKFGLHRIPRTDHHRKSRTPGITIDNKLSFKQHINLLENRVACSVGKVSYYLPFNILITLYHALVHSQLLYALPIWASTYKTYLNKLEKLQNKA